MTISVVFDPPLPSDSPAVFNSKAFTLVGDLNDWSTQANAVADQINVAQPNVDIVAGNIANINAAVADLPALSAKVSKTGDTMTGPLSVPAGASGAQVPRAQEIPALVRAFMHAAVSQSGGNPTGGIVEYGSNANGEYWRLSNRLQICITAVVSGTTSTAAGSIFMSGGASQTWPAVFAAAPEVSVSVRNSSGANCWAGDYAVSATGISSLRAFSTANTAVTTLAVIAIGRWF